MICEYGCGQKANHQFKNGKWCCNDNHSKCLGIKEKWKYSRKGKSAGKNNGMYGKSGPLNPFFGKTHSEEQKKKWKIDRNKEEYKKNMSEVMEKLWKEDWFYESHVTYTKEQLGALKSYYRDVWRFTNQSIKKDFDIINPSNLVLSYETFHIDHIFSIIEGFKNNIDPCIIGNTVNLQVLSKKDNMKKRCECWITKKELEEKYNANNI